VSDRPPASSSGVQPTPTAQASGNRAPPPPVRNAGQAAAVVLAGSLDYATVVRNRPRTLGAWRVTTTSRRTADRVAQLLGGRVQQDLTGGLVEVLTTSPTVEVLLTGPAALGVRWQHAASDCDGVTQGDGCPCACPPGLVQRRAAGKQGRGCRPCAELRFRLTSRPQLGTFGFSCEDWSFVELVARTQAALRGRPPGEPARARLGLRRSLHTLRSGIVLPYTHPVIALLGDHGPASTVRDVEAVST
jgi:Recombination directionality factor-like